METKLTVYDIAENLNMVRGYEEYPMVKHFKDYSKEEYKKYLKEKERRWVMYYDLDTNITRPHIYLNCKEHAKKIHFSKDTLWHFWDDRLYDLPLKLYNKFKIKK